MKLCGVLTCVAFLSLLAAGAAATGPAEMENSGIYRVGKEQGKDRVYCVLERVSGGFDIHHPQRSEAATPAGPIGPAGEMWRVEDWDGSYGAIAEEVRISANGMRLFTAWDLNYERFSCFSIASDTPEWEYPLADATHTVNGSVQVDISDDGQAKVGGVSRMADLVPGAIEYSRVYKFSATATPDWTFDLPTSPTQYHLVDVCIAGDGSTVGVLAVDDGYTTGKVYVLDGGTGSVNHEWDFDYSVSSSIYNVAFNEDVTLMAVGCRNLIHVYDIPGGLKQTITLDYDCQCPAVISSSGDYIVVGNLRGRLTVYKLDGGTGQYAEDWFYTIPPDYYYPWIQTVAIAEDESRVIAGSYQPNATEQHGYVTMYDITGNIPIWTSDDSGDLVQEVACRYDGDVIAAASWGDVNDTMGWRYKLARFTNDRYTIASTDYEGSFFTADIDRNGYFAAGGTKRVHARDFGSGGHVFAFNTGIKVETYNANLYCVPSSGTLPFKIGFFVDLENLSECQRDVYGRVDAIVASGTRYNGYREGSATLAPFGTYHTEWFLVVPQKPYMIGDNTFILTTLDVTAPPYNQPPCPPDGDKDMDTFVVTVNPPE